MVPQLLAIVNILQSKGWRAVPSQGGWQLSREATEGNIQMSVTPHGWLCLTLPLQNDLSTTALLHEKGEGYRILLERNVDMFLAKFALDRDDIPLLMAEVGLKDTDPMLAYWAVEALAQYKAPKKLETFMEMEWAMARSLTPQTANLHRTVNFKLKGTAPKLPDVVGGVSDDTIKLYLNGIQVYGWSSKKKLEGFSWHLLYRGRHRFFDVYLSSSRMWVYFQVPILVERIASVLTIPEGNTNAQQLRTFFLKYLLRLNQSWFLAKIGISTDDQVLLLLEIPTQLLDFTLFRQAARAIEIYLDRFEQEIQIMASLQHNQRLFELLHMSNY
jgi:hypothetical protein